MDSRLDTLDVSDLAFDCILPPVSIVPGKRFFYGQTDT